MSERPDALGELREHGATALTLALAALAVLGVSVLSGRHAPPPHAVDGPSWLADVTRNLAQRGYDWMKIDIADGVATVSGDAPDVDSRQYGVDAAETAIGRADAAHDVRVVVDATELNGAPGSVGAAFAGLGAAPTVDACQRAFDATMSGRRIDFEPAGAALTGDNRRLLDALSAVALRCRSYRIEIGGHTGGRAPAVASRVLSEARANAVRAYLTDKGVSAGALTAVGYGGDKPLDPAPTPDAAARNERIAFTVSAS